MRALSWSFLCLLSLSSSFTVRTPTKGQTRLRVLSESTSTPSSLPKVPDPSANPYDDVFRWTRKNWPVSFINQLRDSGFTRFLQDTLVVIGIPALLNSYPELFEIFLKCSNVLGGSTELRIESYGSHPLQTMELLESSSSSSQENNSKDLIVFCHGGAWNSGRPWMYRSVASSFLNENTTVVIWGYRTYPDANVSGQVDDLHDCIDYLKHQRDYKSTTIIGHSSGAHVSMLATLTRPDICDMLVSLSIVSDIPYHFDWESGRGVEEVSALKPACGYTRENWMSVSPNYIVRNGQVKHMPPVLLVHGDIDVVVPYTSSYNLSNAFQDWGIDHDLEILPGIGHIEPVLHMMVGGISRNVVGNWLKRAKQID